MPSTESAAITVSQLNRRAKTLLEKGMTRCWVEGEISNLSRPASGHIYLSLKDASAQVSAAWFRQRQRGPASNFKNGDRVLAYGRVSLYEARGNYQLIIERLEPAGEGVLKRRFDALKNKLAAEGLFDEERKQGLPALPGRIGVITSPSGAALHDILSILRRRFSSVPVVVYPAAVQGDAAPAELIAALHMAITRAECDVLIIGRGGGSLEDLWAFNDEQLARAMSECPVPIISAVGHEVDFTIADFVADVRAPTPSGAAEIVVPDRTAWLQSFSSLTSRLARIGQRTVEERAQMLDWLSRRLFASSPTTTLRRHNDQLRECSGRLTASIQQHLLRQHNQLHSRRSDLLPLSPALALQRLLARLAASRQRLIASVRNAVAENGHRTDLLARALHTVSPLATLDRGYAVVSNDANGQILRNVDEISSGGRIRTQLARGQLIATVSKVIKED